jgi:ubiquinone/menaquinone biosynthesis C-methylase UbiE
LTGSVPAQTEGRAIRWARLYDLGTTLFSLGRASALDRKTVELAGIAPGERILDVGCGPGRLAILAGSITGPEGEVCGIDPAPEMVGLATRKAARARVPVRFEVGVIEALPYPDERFDVVLSSMMLHHLPGDLPRRGFAEVRRVLRPGGRFVAVDFGATPGEGLGHILCVLGLRRGQDHAEHLGDVLATVGFETVEIGPFSRRGVMFIRGRKPAAMPKAT